MAKIKYIDLVDRVQGKFCKKDPNGAIFAHRKASDTCYVYHVHNPSTAPATPNQVAVREKFNTAVQATKAIMADSAQMATYVAPFKAQTRYSTLRGFIFAQEYNKL